MNYDIVRAWKDDAYRASLDADTATSLPDHPVGDLSEAELSRVLGGNNPHGTSSAAAAASNGARRDGFANFWRTHTFSGFCDLTLRSLTLPAIDITQLLHIANCPPQQICAAVP